MLTTLKALFLFFISINLAIFISGFETWLGWDFIGIISFLLAFLKVITLLSFIKILTIIFNLDEHPLPIAAAISGVILVFISSSYTGDYQHALYQKTKIGKAVKIKASKLHLQKELLRTPYIIITHSGLGEASGFRKRIGKAGHNEVFIDYCYAPILNTVEPAILINTCNNKSNTISANIQNQLDKEEIIAELLAKKVYFRGVDGLQFYVTQPTFKAFYQKKEKAFFNYIKIINTIGIGLVLLFFIIFRRTKTFFGKKQ